MAIRLGSENEHEPWYKPAKGVQSDENTRIYSNRLIGGFIAHFGLKYQLLPRR